MNGPIALTGATGFVGRRVVALAAETGVDLRVLARQPSALILPLVASQAGIQRSLRVPAGFLLSRERADGVRQGDSSELQPPPVPALAATIEVIEGDILDDDALARLTAGAAALIHCAGAIAGSPETLTSVNVEGTRRIAAAARRAATARFVHVSSLAAREPGLSGYALSKRLGEREVMDGLAPDRWVILRPPVVYGPGDPATLPLMDQFTRPTAWLPGSRRQRFSLIYADDLARALLHLARSQEPSGSIHELHDGRAEGYAWADIAEAAVAAEGQPNRVVYLPRAALDAISRLSQGWTRLTGHRLGPEISPGKVRELYHLDWVCRHRLLDEASQWSPMVRLPEGLALTLDWYRRNGWLPVRTRMAKRLAGTDHGVRPG